MSKCMWYWLIANATSKRLDTTRDDRHAAIKRANNNHGYRCWHILDRGASDMRTTDICRAAYNRSN